MAVAMAKANTELMDRRIRYVTIGILWGGIWQYRGRVYQQSLFFPCSALCPREQCYPASLVLYLPDWFSQWEALAGVWKAEGRRFQCVSPLLYLPLLVSPAIAASPPGVQLPSESPSLCGPSCL